MVGKESWELIDEVISAKDRAALERVLDALPPAENARAISRLSEESRIQLLELLEPKDAAELIEDLPDAQAADFLEELSSERAAAIVTELESEDRADVLGAMDQDDARAVLSRMDVKDASDTAKLLSFDQGTAGSIMSTEFAVFRVDATIQDLLTEIRSNVELYRDYSIFYVYVNNQQGQLEGVIPVRNLLFELPHKSLGEVLIRNPVTLPVDSSLDQIRDVFESYSFLAIPVTDSSGRMVGVVRKTQFQEAMEESADKTFLRVAGIVGGEELRTLPLRERTTRRLSILTVNILLNLMGASVIAYYQDTLSAVIALAVFLPILSDLSGCSGNQAVAVSIRELTVGSIRPRDYWFVIFSEMKVGIINGIVLGGFLGLVAFLWKGNIYLSMVVGTALCLNTLLAVTLGGLIPLLLRAVRIDPALASAPILTTFTDMCGFFLVLSLATAFLKHLSILTG